MPTPWPLSGVLRVVANSSTASATSGLHRQLFLGATRASLVLEFTIASNAPKRSDSIYSSRVGEIR